MWDEDTSDERTAVSVSFADPYLAILRDDSTLLLLQADDSGDVDETALNEEVTSNKWISCCLYHDSSGIFNLTDRNNDPQSGTLLFLLSTDSKLFVCELDFPIPRMPYCF